jgi:ATPase family AAA domain-containing protein 3A/B
MDENQKHAMELIETAEVTRRESQKDSIITFMNMASSNLSGVFSNPKVIAKLAYFAILTIGAFQISKLGFSYIAANVLSKIGKPNLIRETSKISSSNFLLYPDYYTRKFIQQRIKRTERDLLDGVILEKKLEDQLREISYAILNRKKHFAPCKNLMFYGPPGTGKTLFAKKLAMKSGLEYVVMVGSDIAPLGPLAVKEINNLFDWSET